MAMAYLADYLPWLHGYTKWAGACLVLCLLAYLNARGIQIAGWVSVALLIAVLIPVVWLCVVSVLHWHHDPLAPFMPPGKPFRSLFGEGLALAMWNYAGYEQLSSITGEMKDPQRDLVRVLAWNTPILIVTSIVPAAFALAVLGNWPDWETGYIVTASRLIGGQALGAAMLIGSLIGVLSLSNSTILYTTRIPATMAEDGYFPIWMGKLSRFGTPARAIATSLVVYCVLAKYRVEDLVNIYIWTRIATSLLTVFAVWGMRAKAPKMFRRFRIPGGPLGILYVIVFPVLLCVVKIYYSEPFVFRWAPLLLASGPVAYAVLRWGLGMTPVSQTGTAAK